MEITQSLHRAAQLNPDRPFTVDGDRLRTVSQGIDRIARLAGALHGLGVAEGERVAMLALNSDRYHEYLLAVPWAGAVVVPINFRWSPAEIAFSLKECDATVIIIDDTFAPMLPAIREGYPELKTVIHAGSGAAPADSLDYEELVAASEPAEDARRGGDDLYGIFYTGGTTGFPKGVMLTQENMMTSAYGTVATGEFVTPRGTLMHAAPMFHLADIAIWLGGIVSESTHTFLAAFTPAGALEMMANSGVTDSLLVPTMIQMMVDSPAAAENDLSGVKHIIYGASPISDAVLERAKALFSNATFLQAYGMTELAPVATVLLAADHADPVLRRSAGRAAPHTEVKVVDENDVEVPRGTVGEVVARGGATMSGYWKRPDDTAEALRGGWMHTGDGGYMDDKGYVYIVDRIKDMIITGGENVYSVEVENVVGKHPSVATCAVIGLPDDKWGERVHAVVVLQPGATLELEDLQMLAREHIAGYKIPRSLSFVDALPMSGAGKVLKRDLRESAKVSA
ncbi:MAG: putative 4-coumarate--CoA ligase 2 2 (4-coumaroyl-CoA synthase 2) [Microbacteriaceae bacterium]|jgi:acyl-CoA synthetase (AMP-forming)/AMP-acid ligase II|nr:putative 4-coumarate--CoA ligase 2 2 (4-coumaroyl-CoA synthase 2) [Microbacteriaceae bacterium]